MELADEAVIRMFRACRAPGVRRTPLPVQFRPADQRPRCHCGICPRCLDDAKWERIFNEKFADPDYYLERLTQQGSSLSGLK